MKPKYFHEFLGIRTGPPIVERSRGEDQGSYATY